MAAWTLAEAREHLAAWLEADAAVAAGQSYTIGSRTITRADVAQIAERIRFWRSEVLRLEAGRTGGIRIQRVVPRDV